MTKNKLRRLRKLYKQQAKRGNVNGCQAIAEHLQGVSSQFTRSPKACRRYLATGMMAEDLSKQVPGKKSVSFWQRVKQFFVTFARG